VKKLTALLTVLIFLTFGIAAWAQSNEFFAPFPGNQQRDEQAWEAQQRSEMAKQENLKRQQDLKKDTDKLLELATELKQYVDKTSENTLSVDVIKKAEEIEKLARSVKDKMRRD
jgi:hypothetical protein